MRSILLKGPCVAKPTLRGQEKERTRRSKIRNFRSICLFVAVLGTALAPTPEDLPRYSLVDLGTMGGSFTGAIAINARPR